VKRHTTEEKVITVHIVGKDLSPEYTKNFYKPITKTLKTQWKNDMNRLVTKGYPRQISDEKIVLTSLVFREM
jgi:hypothetical protein